MKTIVEKQMRLQAMMTAARETHTYKVETTIMEFTEEMMQHMAKNGISKSDLARKIGVNPAYITKILRGTTNFTLDTMVKIATALDCEYRSHLQPSGQQTQWFDLLHCEPGTTFAYHPGNFQVVDISPMPPNEARPLAS